MEVTITGLYHYPVKSCAGIPLAQCSLTPKGVLGDREWAVINAQGQFLSQRKLPRMALIQVKRQPQGLILKLNDDHPSDVPNCTLNFPTKTSPSREVHIWSDSAQGFLAEEHANRWLTHALHSQEPLFLAWFNKATERLPGYPERFGANATYFADAAPFLIANALSLYTLNELLAKRHLHEVDIRNFRPNIVISGLPAFAEHQVRALKHPASGIEFTLVDACQRCAIITINPDTGVKLPYSVPFKQLTELNPMPGNKKAPAFGVNAKLREPVGEMATKVGLRLGDKLQVIQ
ncbi:MOSC domain-containing protein [Teredinibacter haidensis]|uniref:MOSC domain-containing protein n=1 Tax=Teredinibacter haidensis TaxID=2731755 RepID=UPI0009489F06|nr:MOSC N-terminal beta barrel domain-containing protein [Teredinibacter haidensis]